jgi:hypothetical protein
VSASNSCPTLLENASNPETLPGVLKLYVALKPPPTFGPEELVWTVAGLLSVGW